VALGHQSRTFGVNDMHVYKLTSDVAGTAPGYGTSVDVVGVKSLETTLATDTKQLRGDNTLLAADSVLKEISGKISYAKHNFDVWTALTSALTTDSGTTPNQISTMTITQVTAPAFFKVEAQSKQVDYVGGDIHVVLYKCMPGNLATGFMEEDYRIQGNDFVAVPLISTITAGPANAWMSIVANESSIAVP
jgi:hypothetical protein